MNISLNDKPFINRELSWLEFNGRVLQLANDQRIPLMERLKFVSIFSSNLDEFFMIRVAGIMDQIELGYDLEDASGLTPKQVLESIRKRTVQLTKQQEKYFLNIKEHLKEYGVFIHDRPETCTGEYCDLLFERVVLPSISPVTLSPSNPFPFIYNLRSVIVIRMRKLSKEFICLIIVPENVKKLFVREVEGKIEIFPLHAVIISKLKEMFKTYDILEHYIIRVTRNADLTIDEEESQDLLKLVEKNLSKRKKGQIVRLEINRKLSPEIEELLIKNLQIKRECIYHTFDFIDLSSFASLKIEKQDLYFKPFTPTIPAGIPVDDSIFEYLKNNEILLYRPYNNFSVVKKLLQIASEDKNTLSIKMTLYRTNDNSSIVKNLIKASENGKTVSVVVELKARFDESMNVKWAKQLEDAGCIVTYGLPGLKVHSKNLLITRNENGKIVEYTHISTGNYNEITANIHTDIDYITAKEEIYMDTTNLFNYLMGYTDLTRWQTITTAPLYLREKLIELIDSTIEASKNNQTTEIIIKVNALVDKQIIEKLYEASSNRVSIKLIVRGICCLKPGIRGLSDNIRVISIVGRFLEHPRIFYFNTHDKEKIFISSADLMERNLDRRIEHLTEITNPLLKEKLKNILRLQFEDNVNSWELKKDRYQKIHKKGKEVDSQAYFIDHPF